MLEEDLIIIYDGRSLFIFESYCSLLIMGTAAAISGKSSNHEYDDRDNIVHSFEDAPRENRNSKEKMFEERKQVSNNESIQGNLTGRSAALQERKISPKENATTQNQRKITASEEYHLAITGKIPMMHLLENDDDIENLEDISIAKSKEKYENHSSKASSTRPIEKLKTQNSSPLLSCNILVDNEGYLSDDASNNSINSFHPISAQQNRHHTQHLNGSPTSNPSMSTNSSPMEYYSPQHEALSPSHAKVPMLPLSAFKSSGNNNNNNNNHQQQHQHQHGLYIFEDAENQLSLQRQKVISAMRNAEVCVTYSSYLFKYYSFFFHIFFTLA